MTETIKYTSKYTSANGYTGILYGRSSLAIFDKNGKEVMHSGFTSIRTYEELVEEVDGFPEFLEMLENHENTESDSEDDQ